MEIEKGVIDLEVLNRISEGNPGLVKHMIEIFIRENPKEISKLEDALKESDYKKIASIVHKMKSAISFSGFDLEVRNLLNEMEETAHSQDSLEKIKSNFHQVRTICSIGVIELTAIQSRFE